MKFAELGMHRPKMPSIPWPDATAHGNNRCLPYKNLNGNVELPLHINHGWGSGGLSLNTLSLAFSAILCQLVKNVMADMSVV